MAILKRKIDAMLENRVRFHAGPPRSPVSSRSLRRKKILEAWAAEMKAVLAAKKEFTAKVRERNALKKVEKASLDALNK